MTLLQRTQHSLRAFISVLTEAARKKPALSAAYAAYNSAVDANERGAAYAAMSQADRDAIHAESVATLLAAYDARVASLHTLPPHKHDPERGRTRLGPTLGTLVFFAAATLFVVANVLAFGFGLFYGWPIWATFAAAFLSLGTILFVGLRLRLLVSIAKALPAAFRAALSDDRASQDSHAT